LFKGRGDVTNLLLLGGGADNLSAAQGVAGEEQGDDQAGQGGQKNALDNVEGGDLTADPQHGGGDVADRGPGPPGIGGDDDNSGKEEPIFVLVEQFLHQRDHDNGGGEVVEDSAEEKGDKANQPEEGAQFGRLDPGGDDHKSVVGIDNFNNGYSAHEEKDDLGGGGH